MIGGTELHLAPLAKNKTASRAERDFASDTLLPQAGGGARMDAAHTPADGPSEPFVFYAASHPPSRARSEMLATFGRRFDES